LVVDDSFAGLNVEVIESPIEVSPGVDDDISVDDLPF